MTDTPTAVAWRLHSPSVSGGKFYDILLFDRFVVVGWGSVGGTMQYKVQSCATATEARALAVAQTNIKEKNGYVLNVYPRTSTEDPAMWAESLPRYVKMRGASTYLDSMFSGIWRDGRALT